jgi:hypothetical protein
LTNAGIDREPKNNKSRHIKSVINSKKQTGYKQVINGKKQEE